jgi:hypothetical protein
MIATAPTMVPIMRNKALLCAATWLTDDRRGSAGPLSIVELEPECGVEWEEHGCPKAQPCRCPLRRRFWPAALLAEIPLSIPVVAAQL